MSGGVSRRSARGKFTTYTIANGLSSNTVASMLEGSDGTMWFATPNGLDALLAVGPLASLHGPGWTSVGERKIAWLEDSSGVLWVGNRQAGLAFRRGLAGFRFPAEHRPLFANRSSVWRKTGMDHCGSQPRATCCA